MRRLIGVLFILVWIAATIGPAYAAGRPATAQAAPSTPAFRLAAITCCFLGPDFQAPVTRYNDCVSNPGLDLWATRQGNDLLMPGPAVRLVLPGTILGFLNSPDQTLQPSPAGAFGLIARNDDPLNPGHTIYTAYIGMAQFDPSTQALGQSYVNQALLANTAYPAGTLLGYQGDIAVYTLTPFPPKFVQTSATQVHFALLSTPLDQCGNGIDPSPYVGANLTYMPLALPEGTPLRLIPHYSASHVSARTASPRLPASHTLPATPAPRPPASQTS